jgi:hypothetical protein
MMRRIAAAALIGAVAAASAAAQEKPLVRSRDGRIQAFVEPAGAWCADVVGARIAAAPDIFAREPETIQRFIGGLRGALSAECPKADALRIRGGNGDKTIYVAHSLKSGGWAVIESPGFDTTNAPGRAPTLDEPAKKNVARVDARLLAAWVGAQNLAIAEEPGRTETMVWYIANTSLTTSIYDLDPTKPATLIEQADALGNADAEACTKDGGQYVDAVANDTPDKVSKRGLRCQKQKDASARYSLAFRQGATVHVIQIQSTEAGDPGGKDAAAIADAFEGVLVKTW